MPYKAFISYSHIADGRLAPAIQSALHKFAKPWYRLRAMRIFRDQTNLSLNPHLWSSIEQALDESEYFILFASHQAATSKWVRQEVGHWLSRRSPESLLILLTDGDIAWDTTATDFDWTTTTALPGSLSKVFPGVPLYLDFRSVRTQTDLSLRNPDFLDKIARIAATLHGRSLDVLVGEDVRQHRLFKCAASIAGTAILAFAIAALWQWQVAVRQTHIAEDNQRSAETARDNAVTARKAEEAAKENETQARLSAEERRKEAERQRDIAFSRELAMSSVSELSVDPERSLLLATRAVRTFATSEAITALRKSLQDSHLRAVLRGHKGRLFDAAFSPDDRYVVTASADGTARLWDAHTRMSVAVLRGHTDSVTGACFSPDGSVVVTSSMDTTARLWRVPSGELLQVLRGHDGAVMPAVFSPNGQLLVTPSFDNTARVWRVDSGKLASILIGHQTRVLGAAFTQDGQKIITAGDITARLWEAADGTQVRSFEGHFGVVNQVNVHPSKPLIVTAGSEYTARIWDVVTGEMVKKLEGHAGEVFTAEFSRDGKRILTASLDGTAALWNVDTGDREGVLRGHARRRHFATFSPDGLKVVTTSDDGVARVWDSHTYKELAVLRGHSGDVFRARFSVDGRSVATAGFDGTARVWAAGTEVARFESGNRGLIAASYLKNGQFVITSSLPWAEGNKSIQVWRTATGKQLARRDGFVYVGAGLGDMAVSPDGRVLIGAPTGGSPIIWDPLSGEEQRVRADGVAVTGVGSFGAGGKLLAIEGKEHSVRLWDVRNRQEVGSLAGHSGELRSIAFSRSSQRLVTTSDDNSSRIWDLSTRQSLAVLEQRELGLTQAMFSPDDRYVLTISGGRTFRDDNEVSLWDARSGRRIGEIKGHDYLVRDATFSPDGRYLLTASLDKTARLWKIPSMQLAAPPLEHPNQVFGAAFHPGGEYVATGCRDWYGRIWDAASGELLTYLSGHTESVNEVAFSPGGRYVLTTGFDGTARVHLCDVCGSTKELLELAGSRSTRGLTDEERARFLHERKPGVRSGSLASGGG